jgi:hypothetical protein
MDDERQSGLPVPTTYEICVAGALDSTWSYALEGLAFSHEPEPDGQRTTVLRGPLDQAALAAVLDALFSLNLTVQSVQLIDPGHHAD